LENCDLVFVSNFEFRIFYFEQSVIYDLIFQRLLRHATAGLTPCMKRQFLFRFDRPFFWPAAALTPETHNL